MTENSTPVPGPEPADREVLTGRVVSPAGGDRTAGRDQGGTGPGGAGPDGTGRRTASMVAGDLAGAAAARAHQVSELLSGASRLLAGVLGGSGVAGAIAAVVITGLLSAAFDWSTANTVIVLVVLALPAVEVLVHRRLLLRTYGDAEALRKRFTDLPDATVGRVQDFAGRLGALKGGPGARSGRLYGAARSAGSLRGVAGAVPELTGVLLLPLTKTLLVLTAVCAVLCWLLLAATPAVAIVALFGALAG